MDGADDDARWLVPLAQAIGEHAAAVYAAALVALLLLAALAWRGVGLALRRLPRLPRASPTVLLAAALGAGFVLIAAAAAVFAEVLDALQGDEALARADEALTAALRAHVSPAALRAFAIATRLGDTATLVVLGVLVAAVLLLRRRPWLALGWSVALAGNGVLNPLLKRIVARARPLHEHGLAHAEGYSFPSGHTSGAVVAFGMLAYLLLRLAPPRWHLPVVLATVALVFTVGCSRVVLQVHWASDVLAGFASGTAWLLVCVVGIEWLRRQRRGPQSAQAAGGLDG